MMVFWLICAGMIAVALAFILQPLLERSVAESNVKSGRKEANVAVYRDQLAELETDLTNGLVSTEQYEQDRDELERRLLEDVASPASASSIAHSKPAGESRAGVIVLALSLPILATALYLQVGNPRERPTRPAASQDEAPMADNNSPVTQERIEGNVAALAKKLEQNPNDAQGWVMLARSYSSLEKYPEASSAYARATALKADDADLWADYAFALAMANGRKLQGQPIEIIGKALKLDPENAKALQLAGGAAFEAGDYKTAIAYWEKLMARTPPDSDVGAALSEKIKQAKSRLAGAPAK
ncbi:MAG: c-type cytochrome biogenesis protein CcmI [Acidobacteriota bacterium]